MPLLQGVSWAVLWNVIMKKHNILFVLFCFALFLFVFPLEGVKHDARLNTHTYNVHTKTLLL